MPRQEITQVVRAPYVPAVQDNKVGSLRQLLMGVQASSQIVDSTFRVIEMNRQAKETEQRLNERSMMLDKQVQLAGIENEQNQERTKASFLREQMDLINKNIREMEENEANGALAELARTPDDKLKESAAAMGIRSPDNLRRIDAAIGERRAINDYRALLETFLIDPTKTPKQHLDAWMEDPARVVGPIEQQAAYAAQLSTLVNQEEVKAIRDKIKSAKTLNKEDTLHNLQRTTAIYKDTWAVDLKTMGNYLDKVYEKIYALDADFSKLDMAEAFSRLVYPELIKNMSGKEQLALAERISTDEKLSGFMAAVGPQFANTLIERGKEQLYQDQNRASTALREELESATYPDAYEIAKARIQQAYDVGDISKVNYDSLQPKILAKHEDMKSLLRVAGKMNGEERYAGVSITQADMPNYEKMLDNARIQWATEHNNQPMPLDEDLKLQMNAGVLTNSTKETIFTMLRAGVVKKTDGTLDDTNLRQGINALVTIKQHNPSAYRDQWEGSKDTLTGSTKLAVNLIDANFSPSEVLGLLSRASNEDFSKGFQAAKTQMSGDAAVSFITKRTDPGYFTWQASREGTSRKAVNLTESLFAYYYVTSPIQDEKERVKFAKDRTASEISQRFGLQDLGDTRYLIDKQSVPESLRGEGSFFSPPMKELIRDVSRITGDTLYVNGLGELKYEVDAIHYDKDYMYIPSVSTFTNSEGKVFELKVPLAPDKLKAWSKNAPKEAAQQISEWNGKTIAPFRGFSRRGM